MYSKYNKISAIIAAIVLAAGLVMGFAMGPNRSDDLTTQNVVSIEMGSTFFEEDVTEAFSNAGIKNTKITLAALGDADPTVAIVTLPMGVSSVPSSVYETIKAKYTASTAGVVEALQPDVMQGHWALKATIGGVIAVALIFLYGCIRYKWQGGLQIAITVAVDAALALALTMITRIPVSLNFLAAIALTASYSALFAVNWQNRAVELSKEKGFGTADSIIAQAGKETTGRRIWIFLVAALLIVLPFILGGTNTLMVTILPVALMGIFVSTLTSIFLHPMWWKLLRK